MFVDQNWSNLPMQFSINYGLNYLPILVASFVGEQDVLGYQDDMFWTNFGRNVSFPIMLLRLVLLDQIWCILLCLLDYKDDVLCHSLLCYLA